MTERDDVLGAVTRPRAYRPVVRALARRRRLRHGVVQLCYVVIALVAGLTLPRLQWGPHLQDERAAAMLFAIGASMLTFTGLVFSLLLLVVQWGTSTFTPRLNLFRDDPLVRHSFGFLVGVLVFCLTAGLRVPPGGEISVIVVALVIVAVLTALILFRQLQIKAFRSIQLASTLADVVSRGRTVLEALYTIPVAPSPERSPIAPSVTEVRWPGQPGVLQQVDLPRLVRRAAAVRSVVVLRVAMGEFLTAGTLVATIHDEGLDADDVTACLTVGPERTFDQDAPLAMRLLVDIGLRALSPAINDPTTAVEVIEGVESLLRLIAGRELDVGHVVGDDNTLQVVVPLPSWEDYLKLGNDDLALAAVNMPTVLRRLERCLSSLADVVPPSRRQSVDERLRWIRRHLVDRRPLATAIEPSPAHG